jgi:hypothetical protein
MITGWFMTMTMIRNILIITIIAALVPTAMSNVSASAASEIALFSSDSDSLSISGNGDNAKMILKATNENGKTKKVSNFQMNADNVLYIKVGDTVTVKDKVDFTKAITTDGNNNQKVIGITSNGVIDFTGYTQGVSTLDVVVDDDRAYEAIIVIGQQPPDIINKQVTKVNNNHDTTFKFIYSDPPPPIDPCVEDPNAEGCEDPCLEDPNAEGCIPIDPCEEDPNAEGCIPIDCGSRMTPDCQTETPNEELVPSEEYYEVLDMETEEEEAEEKSGGSEDEVENDDDEEGGGESEEESTDGEGSDDSGETFE